MEDIRNSIYTTIMKINQYCDLLMLAKYKHVAEYNHILIESLSVIIPEIIKSYDKHDALKDMDRTVWVDQLKRIMWALESDDDFFKIDILKIETVDKLQLYLSLTE